METRSNALEKVIYKWTTHYFEGIRETNLVLEPPQATNRDGILGSNSLFPRAYSTRPAIDSSGATNYLITGSRTCDACAPER